MDYNDYNDEELFMMVCEDEESAKEILFNKYKHVMDIIIKKYSYSAKALGLDYKELYSEALIGFTDAINNYDSNKKAGLNTFITLCINSRLQKLIEHVKTDKNRINTDTYSLDHVYDEFGISLSEVISDNQKNDPLENMVEDEKVDELTERIKKDLSAFECQVFDLMINNFSYTEIANILEKSPKQIDNTIQRLKSKAKKTIEEEKMLDLA